MKTKLYREMVARSVAMENCAKSGNDEWYEKHETTLNQLIDLLPHGSGIDSDWKYEIGRKEIKLFNSYLFMDEFGGYDGWTEFTVSVRADLLFGIVLNINGKFGKYQDVKDYLYEIMEYSLNSEIEFNKTKDRYQFVE